ncbi:hypothetical protein PHYSODRAFT_297963 [Phytophthora sojae]|uniref:RxLR effector protein n=1 Tax=Phytophthora sojae (strain P6497) TaxID=1094619 RepID=G4Z3K8_PHYSP|nr:hypothetical protein PHYSODRAFT_297963 [Phytophthora sojae]EGZ19380.1 hypothetical protein PHYSODRAFT_297963 [Phytophthora sojae]|eukprot:XP_009522097.1 hypothetical protein PHYSODRAFT_297963 [Phytophthora sojae]
MQMLLFLATLVLAIAGSAIFAAGQDTTKATLFIGSSQNSAESVVLEEVVDEHRRLEVTGESHVQDIALFQANIVVKSIPASLGHTAKLLFAAVFWQLFLGGCRYPAAVLELKLVYEIAPLIVDICAAVWVPQAVSVSQQQSKL